VLDPSIGRTLDKLGIDGNVAANGTEPDDTQTETTMAELPIAATGSKAAAANGTEPYKTQTETPMVELPIAATGAKARISHESVPGSVGAAHVHIELEIPMLHNFNSSSGDSEAGVGDKLSDGSGGGSKAGNAMAGMRGVSAWSSMSGPGFPKLVICGSFCPEAGPTTFDMVVEMVGTPRPKVLYMGAASYDSTDWKYRQILHFINMGCEVRELKITYRGITPSTENMREMMDWADVFVPSAGNAVFMIDRVNTVGLAKMITDFLKKGKVIMSGGEGAVMAFDGGPSDALSPSLRKRPNPANMSESLTPVRANGLAPHILPGMICTGLHDVARKPGNDRFDVCKEMLTQHSGEVAVGIDESAAIAVSGEDYVTLGKGVMGMGTGVYTMRIEGDHFITDQARSSGKVSELVQQAKHIEEDPLLQVCRQANPDDEDAPAGHWIDSWKEQIYAAFLRCDADKSEGLSASELANCFDTSVPHAAAFIKQHGRETNDDVLHPFQFANFLSRLTDEKRQFFVSHILGLGADSTSA